MTTKNLKKVSIEDIANKEASKKVKPTPDKSEHKVEAHSVFTKPKGEFDDKSIHEHPVLKKLKSALGIKPLELHTKKITVDGLVLSFDLTEYPEELNIFCAEEYRKSLMTIGEARATKIFDYLRVGCSLVAIDGAPIYEVFGVELELEDLDRVSKNAFDLSDRLRKECAKIFCRKVLSELRDFVSALEEHYVEKIINKAVIGSFDSLPDSFEVYICEVPGCSFIHKAPPMYDDSGREVPYVCAAHAVPLRKALTPSERANFPLE